MFNYHTLQGHLVYFNSKFNNSGLCYGLGTYVPNNIHGYQFARTGTGYAAIGGRGYIAQVFQINGKLHENRCYEVRYFVSRSDFSVCATNAIDGLFAKDSIHLDYLKADTVMPKVKNGNVILEDTALWIEIRQQYIADGSENYFCVGNFFDLKRKGLIIKECHDSTIYHYGGNDYDANSPHLNGPVYYLDDVAIWECGTPEYPANAGSDRKICLGEEAEIGAMEARDESLYLWSERSWHGPRHTWDTLATTPKLTVSPQKSTTYYLWSIDFKFEHTYDSVTVFVENCNIDLEIPNVFTPNGDGYNDYLIINNRDQVNYTLEVFNRWGSQVFVGNQDFFWDGTFNGEPAPAGAYFYVLRATTPDGTLSKDFHGSVTILR